MTTFEIRVFGTENDDVEFGGWGLDLRTTSYEEAEARLRVLLEEYGWDDVMWDWDSEVALDFCPEDDEPADIDSDFGFDPYEGCYTYDCQVQQKS